MYEHNELRRENVEWDEERLDAGYLLLTGKFEKNGCDIDGARTKRLS
jgi:hypothetical protein